MLHPELPTCGECQKWVYDPTKGWKQSERGGKPVRRESGSPTPCGLCPKIPRGERPHPAHAVELSDDNYRAWLHYQRCKAVGRFPADAMVERNAGIIRTIEEQVARDQQERYTQTVVAAMMTAALTKGKR